MEKIEIIKDIPLQKPHGLAFTVSKTMKITTKATKYRNSIFLFCFINYYFSFIFSMIFDDPHGRYYQTLSDAINRYVRYNVSLNANRTESTVAESEFIFEW